MLASWGHQHQLDLGPGLVHLIKLDSAVLGLMNVALDFEPWGGAECLNVFACCIECFCMYCECSTPA